MEVLITAGPTWVALDKVRVLTSIFSGSTGLVIAQAFANAGAKVHLLMGPGQVVVTAEDEDLMKVQRFKYFDDLESLVTAALNEQKFDAIVHSAAVADYEPVEKRDEKIPSGYDEMTISLKPTRKLIKMIREKAPGSFLIQFKLETGKSEEELISAAWNGLIDVGGDIVVANLLEQISENSHTAYIIDPERKVFMVTNKEQLAAHLVAIASGDDPPHPKDSS